MYLRFLSAVLADKSSSPYKQLDATELQLLEHALLADNRDEQLLVGDILYLRKFGSQATLHGRIKSLVRHGYFKLVLDKEDGRKKHIILTKMAHKYDGLMSEHLASAAEGIYGEKNVSISSK